MAGSGGSSGALLAGQGSGAAGSEPAAAGANPFGNAGADGRSVPAPMRPLAPPIPSDSEPICDGGDTLRLFYSSDFGYGFEGPADDFANPLGHFFVLVDGQCRFYASDGNLFGIRTGTLNASDAEQLASDVSWTSLRAWSKWGSSGGCTDGGTEMLGRPEGRVVCGCDCGARPDGLGAVSVDTAMDNAVMWAVRLSERGDPVASVRAIAVPSGGPYGHERPWPLSQPMLDIEGLVRDDILPGAGVLFVDPDEVEALRTLRLSIVQSGEPGGHTLDEGLAYYLLIRDELPSEVVAMIEAASWAGMPTDYLGGGAPGTGPPGGGAGTGGAAAMQEEIMPVVFDPYPPGTSGWVRVEATTRSAQGDVVEGIWASTQFYTQPSVINRYAVVLDPLEGVDDCGVYLPTGLATVGGLLVPFDPAEAWLLDGADRLAFEKGAGIGMFLDLLGSGRPAHFGQTYGFEASGGGLDEPVVVDSFPLPPRLSIPEVDALVTMPRIDLRLSWTGTGTEPLLLTILAHDAAMLEGLIFRATEIICTLEDDGAFELPGHIFEHLPANTLLSMSVSRHARVIVDTGGRQILASGVVAAEYRLPLEDGP